jgi:hypothetical protein
MDQEKKKLLVFGYGFAAIFTFIGVRLWVKHGGGVVPGTFGLAAFLMLGMTLLKRDWLKIVYVRWMRVTKVIGIVLTTIILTLVFYLVFGLAGIVLRLLKKDLLDQKIEPQRTSYWQERKVFEKEQSSYLQQF